MKLSRTLVNALTLTLLLALPQAAFAAAIEGEVELEPPEEGTPFGYSGPNGPQHWGDLDPDWTLCGDGLQQSPIDIYVLDAQPRDLPDLEINYHESPVEFLNNGHTVQMIYEEGSSIVVDGVEYELLQFHFHTPSEHTFQGGAGFPVEMHLVHRSASGGLAVIGVFIRQGEHNPGLPYEHRLRQYLPTAQGVIVHIGEKHLDAADLLPDDHRYFRYDGSLTTPPCSEGVKWLVMKTPIEVSKGQLGALTDTLHQLRNASWGVVGTNTRPTQPLFGRTVELDTMD